MEKTVKTVRRRPGKAGKGFTLVELLFVIALLGIMASIVVPRMGWGTMGIVQSKTASREFANYLKLARSLAVTNASSNADGYTIDLLPSDPYTSYEVKNEETDVTVKGPITIPTGVSCTGDATFNFTPLGQLNGGATKTVVFSKGGDTSTVTVTAIGRITIQ